MGRVVRFSQPEPIGPALRRSLDLMDVAERIRLAALAFEAAAVEIDRAHYVPNTPEPVAAFQAVHRAAMDACDAIAEFAGVAVGADDIPPGTSWLGG